MCYKCVVTYIVICLHYLLLYKHLMRITNNCHTTSDRRTMQYILDKFSLGGTFSFAAIKESSRKKDFWLGLAVISLAMVVALTVNILLFTKYHTYYTAVKHIGLSKHHLNSNSIDGRNASTANNTDDDDDSSFNTTNINTM